MKVKVVGASGRKLWYKNRVGEIFDVEVVSIDDNMRRTHGFTYKVVNCNRYFKLLDVKEVMEKPKDQIIIKALEFNTPNGITFEVKDDGFAYWKGQGLRIHKDDLKAVMDKFNLLNVPLVNHAE